MIGSFGDPVPQHADTLDLQFDRVARAQPPVVAVFEDAAGADRPGSDDVSRPEPGVLARPRDDRIPGVVQVRQANGALRDIISTVSAS
jgi:hypothetical protein